MPSSWLRADAPSACASERGADRGLQRPRPRQSARPGEPEHGGRPEGFNAIASYSAIRLQWTPRPDLAVDGFQLQRLAPGDSLYRALGATRPTTAGLYIDSGVNNGQPYRYRLYYVLAGALVPHPAEDMATAGPLRPFVADAGAGEIVQLTPDGRDVVARWTQFGSVQSLAVDALTGLVWGASSQDGLVGTFAPSGFETWFAPGISQPFTLAIDPQDRSAWICDLAGALWHRSATGTALPPGQIPLLDAPTGVAVNAGDRSVWVCENGGQRVRHYSPVGSPIATAFLSGAPSRVDTDSLSRLAWVTSLARGLVWRIAPNGALLDSSQAASGPIGIAIDRARSRVWVADAVGNRVLALDLSTLAVLVSVGGIGEPRDVAVDRTNGDVWVVARAERAVLRLASDGRVLDRVGGFTDPYEVRLDPGLN